MTFTPELSRSRVTSRTSMSWYLRPSHPLLKRSVELVDALTVAGRKGPAEIRRLRDGGFSVPVADRRQFMVADGEALINDGFPLLPTLGVAAPRKSAFRRCLATSPSGTRQHESWQSGVTIGAIRIRLSTRVVGAVELDDVAATRVVGVGGHPLLGLGRPRGPGR